MGSRNKTKFKTPPPTKLGQDVKLVGDSPDLDRLLPKSSRHRKTMRSFWSSPEVFADHIASLDVKAAWHDSAWDDDNGFRGTKSMEEAIALAKEGWKEGRAKVSRLMGKILAANPIRIKPVRYGIAGAVPNVPRAIAGNPLNMRIPDKAKASKRPIITLINNTAAHCGHDSDEFLNRAAVVAALIDRLEGAGYACDVVSFAAANSGYDFFGGGDLGDLQFICGVKVKDSNQPVDIGRLAFGLGHPSFVRRLIFAEKGHDHYCRELGCGLGYPTEVETEGLADRNVFEIPSMNHIDFFRTEELAETKGLAYIIKSLREQGFKGFEDEEVKIAA